MTQEKLPHRKELCLQSGSFPQGKEPQKSNLFDTGVHKAFHELSLKNKEQNQ